MRYSVPSERLMKRSRYALTRKNSSSFSDSSSSFSSDSSASVERARRAYRKKVIKRYASLLEEASTEMRLLKEELFHSMDRDFCPSEEQLHFTIHSTGPNSSEWDRSLSDYAPPCLPEGFGVVYEDTKSLTEAEKGDKVEEASRALQQSICPLSTLSSQSTFALPSVVKRICFMNPELDKLNERYHKLLKIGEGRFGEVHIVYDAVAKVYLTMKRVNHLLHLPKRYPVGLHKTTLRELELPSVLQHPNIVSLIDFHLLPDGNLLIFLPLIRHDFVNLIRTWPFGENVKPPKVPLHVVKCFFRQMVEGVGYLHAMHMVHRDIKPNNIMVDEWGVIRIIDFGWGRVFPAASISPRMVDPPVMTPPCAVSYRPPEILMGKPYSMLYDCAVDVWCCGCVLFELLTAIPLVSGRSEQEALDSLVTWLGSPPAELTFYYSSSSTQTLKMPKNVKSSFMKRCHGMGVRPEDAAFLLRFLDWDPANRIRLTEARGHPWFSQPPAACSPSEVVLPSYNSFRLLRKKQKKM